MVFTVSFYNYLLCRNIEINYEELSDYSICIDAARFLKFISYMVIIKKFFHCILQR